MSEENDQLSTYQRFLRAALEVAGWKAFVAAAFEDPEANRDLFQWHHEGPMPADFLAATRTRLDRITAEKTAIGRAAYLDWVAELAETDLLAAAVAAENPWTGLGELSEEPPQPRLRLVKGEGDD